MGENAAVLARTRDCTSPLLGLGTASPQGFAPEHHPCAGERGCSLGGGGAPRKQPYLILRYAAAPKTSTTTTMTVMVMATMLPVESPSERAALSLPKSQSRSTQPAPRLLPIHPCQPSLVGGNIPSPLPKAPVEDAGHICIFAMASFP